MDKVTIYSINSLCAYLSTNLVGLKAAYNVGTDFDWDLKRNISNPGNQEIRRDLPFAGVVIQRDGTNPFTMGNILYDRTILVHIELCCENHTQLIELTADLKQAIYSAVNAQTGGIGIPLYNYSVASGSYFENAGTMQVEVGASQYFGEEKPLDFANRKYLSITPVELSAYKDISATLLENKGRLNISDS